MGLMGIASTDIPRSSVNWMEVARTCANLVPFDMANLLYSCALPSAAHAVHGDYTYALAKLKRYLLFYQQEKVPLLYVLDGRTNCFKANEDLRRNQDRQQALAEIEARRQSGEEPNMKLYQKCLSNTSRYIGLVARLLQSMELLFIVAPGEADGQLAACAKDGVVISSDNDMLALGVVRKIRVLSGGWMSGEAEMLSLVDCPPSSNSDPDLDPDRSVSDSTKEKKPAPLRDVYRQHGVDGLVFFAATCGCDFTPMKSGIPGVGPTTICALLLSVEGRLTPQSFTDLVKNNVNELKRMPEEFRSEIVMAADPDLFLNEYVLPVTNAFRSALYYTPDFKVMKLRSEDNIIDGGSLSIENNRRHARGELDPKTGDEYLEHDRIVLNSFNYQMLGKDEFHPASSFENMKSSLIPDDFESFDVPRLRGIVAARGGRVTLNKPELLEIVQAMKDLEEDYGPVTIDNSGGLMLPSISFKTTLNPALEIGKMLETNEMQLERNRWAKDILKVAQECYDNKKVEEDYEKISEISAFCDRQLLNFYFSDVGTVGESNKKCLKDSYSKHLEQISIEDAPQRYHGYAVLGEDQHLLITTQSASFKKDESSRPTKERGQKPDPIQYLSILEFCVQPTSIETGDLHGFGKIVDVSRAFCVCKSGAGKCVHDGMAIRDHIRMWGPLSADERVCTSNPKTWKNRGADKTRVFNPMRPIRELGFEKLVEGKKKTFRAFRQPSYQNYDVLSAGDMDLFEIRVNQQILFPFYDALQNGRKDNRPCRAALLYRGDDIKDVEPGLIDIRHMVHLWGSMKEIADAESNKENRI